MDSLRASVRFLTVLPVAEPDPGQPTGSRWMVAWFPLVGLLIGLSVYGALLLPLPDLPRAALALAVWILLTGALHEDGCADSIDAALAPVARERRLEILRDPHVGAFGVTALVLLQLLRLAALVEVPAAAALVAPVVGRWAMAVALSRVPAARPDGLGARMSARAGPVAPTIVAGLLLGTAALFAADSARVLAAWATGAAAGVAMARFLSRRFGGLTGDGYGTVGLAAELAALWAYLPLGRGGS